MIAVSFIFRESSPTEDWASSRKLLHIANLYQNPEDLGILLTDDKSELLHLPGIGDPKLTKALKIMYQVKFKQSMSSGFCGCSF